MQNDQTLKNEERIYAGFFVRLTAYLLDRLILCVPLVLIRLGLWMTVPEHSAGILNRNIFFTFSPKDIVLYAVMVTYFISLTYIWGRTPGKRIMKLRVISSADRKPSLFEILFRETFGRFLSSFILGIGYLIIGAGDEKEALHDYLADTRVIYDINS